MLFVEKSPMKNRIFSSKRYRKSLKRIPVGTKDHNQSSETPFGPVLNKSQNPEFSFVAGIIPTLKNAVKA